MDINKEGEHNFSMNIQQKWPFNEHPINVLIIDDNKIFLNIVQNFLLRHSEIGSVMTAFRVNQGLEILSQEMPDIVILDLDIPEINGLEALPMIAHIAPELPVIILSMMDSQPYQDAVIKAGARAFVSKNTMGQELIPVIRQVLSQ